MITYGHKEVEDTIKARGAVVALETAVLTHGLPAPMNLETVLAMEDAVRASGAVPATIGIIDGSIIIGLTYEQLARLADISNTGGDKTNQKVQKAGARDIAILSVNKLCAGTTVSGTLAICKLAGISVFATGGIGGVHRGWSENHDISADLLEISRTKCCIVSSGAKAILDLPATLEALESLCIPVLGYKTDAFAQFYTQGSENSLPVPHKVDDVSTVARICINHWDTLKQSSGILLANPVPVNYALPHEELDLTINQAITQMKNAGITGSAVTPYLLQAVSDLSAGKTLQANTELLKSNARLAGQLAVELVKQLVK